MMVNLVELAEAINDLGELDITMWGDLGEHLGCSEASVVGDLLEAVGLQRAAQYLLTGHYYNDTDAEEEVANHGEPEGQRDSRIVPGLMWDEGAEPY